MSVTSLFLPCFHSSLSSSTTDPVYHSSLCKWDFNSPWGFFSFPFSLLQQALTHGRKQAYSERERYAEACLEVMYIYNVYIYKVMKQCYASITAVLFWRTCVTAGIKGQICQWIPVWFFFSSASEDHLLHLSDWCIFKHSLQPTWKWVWVCSQCSNSEVHVFCYASL